METTAAAIPGNRKEHPVVFYLRMLLYMFVALLIRVVALIPLAALFVFGTGSPLRWLALLCPVLIVFLVLPLRMSFAQAMVQLQGERRFSFDRALSTSDYGEKLGESLLHALHVLKWALPLAGMTAALVYFYYNTDLISLMQGLSDLGAGVTTVLYAIGNFFIGIFGGEQLVQNAGLMEGLYTVVAILGLGVLILVWGMMRNGAYRFIWVLADRAEKNPRAEARRRPARPPLGAAGRRGDQPRAVAADPLRNVYDAQGRTGRRIRRAVHLRKHAEAEPARMDERARAAPVRVFHLLHAAVAHPPPVHLRLRRQARAPRGR